MRPLQETLLHHLQATAAGDIDEIITDYTDDAMIITPGGVWHGKAGVREVFTKLLSELPGASWKPVGQIFDGDVLLLEWTAQNHDRRVDDGVDTFVFKNGLIQIQTARFTLKENDSK